MDVNEIPIFVSSADSYSDIWPAFFTLFKREWPEYRGTIYLNTQFLPYSFDGLNIVATQLGTQRLFGKTFKAGLDALPNDDFLLLMIDYFFEKRVNVPKLQYLYDVFLRDGLDTLTLNPNPASTTHEVADAEDCVLIENGTRASRRAMFGYQAAFWRRSTLKRFIVDFENPWRSEFYGSQRFGKSSAKFYCLKNMACKPIQYDEAGVLHGGGKWLDSALSRIDLTGVPLDLTSSRRQHYQPSTHPKIDYIMHELHYLPSRLRSIWTARRWPKDAVT